MKVCPKCQKQYSDETLNFCLNDGAVLSQASDSDKPDDSLPATVMMDPPRPTAPNQNIADETKSGFGDPPPTPLGGRSQSQGGWGSQTTNQVSQPKPKSKAWLWVLGILFGVIFLCGGGLALIVAFSSFEGTQNSNSGEEKKKEITFKDPEETPTKSSSEDNGDYSEIDISECEDIESNDADIEYKNQECIIGTKKRGYYYVIVMGSEYQTDDGRTRITVRNTDEKNTRLGFGLVFHSKPTPLEQGYAFLIDSKNQKYRVVRHKNQKESVVINWKKSKTIKTGSQKNVLEVRDDDGKIDLYINGQYIETLKNKDGYDGGVPGIYTSDGIPIAFSNFQTTE